jgi:ubiquinone/menaquinone biosynthesis C-methylase UbiE
MARGINRETTKPDVALQFDRTSHAYASSVGHAKGRDLDILLNLLDPRPEMDVLDVATGAGHTAAAIAPRVRSVVAIDISQQMLERTRDLILTRGLDNVKTQIMDAEDIEFEDRSFDCVACRIAPHHFLNVRRSLEEMTRVVKKRGCLVIEDSCAPEDPLLDKFINRIEVVRDVTHIRSYTWSEWKHMLSQFGFAVRRLEVYRKAHDFSDWVERSLTDEARRSVLEHEISTAPKTVRDYFEIIVDGSGVRSFTDDKVIFRAEREV